MHRHARSRRRTPHRGSAQTYVSIGGGALRTWADRSFLLLQDPEKLKARAEKFGQTAAAAPVAGKKRAAPATAEELVDVVGEGLAGVSGRGSLRLGVELDGDRLVVVDQVD